MNTIKAIETRYAGCRFRSRLEARWAVYFDAISCEWQYEPEGYMIDDLAGSIWSGPYLPDFRTSIPLNGWVEVKGNPSVLDVRKAAAAAIPHGGLPEGLPLWLLGPFGRPDQYPSTVVLRFHKGDVFWARPWEKVGTERLLASDSGLFYEKPAEQVVAAWKNPGPELPSKNGVISQAIRAVRSARFEHGEQG